MSSDRVPSRSEVMRWSPQHLADYLKRMNLSGCDKVVLKNGISGSRFVNLSENDLQKFPKLHAPMVSKISCEISKKEEKRGLFSKKAPAPKYPEAEVASDTQGWGDDEFDDEEFDNDYESPYSDEDGSGGDYESPNEDGDAANDYEPPPTEPPEDMVHKLCPTMPIGDGDYIDKRVNHLPPPAVCPRPPVQSLSAPTARMPGESSSRRDPSPSPHSAGRPSGKFPPEPPQISRANKPGRDSGSTQSPVRGPHRNTLDMAGAQPWRPQQDGSDLSRPKPPLLPPPSSTSVSRSNSSVRPSPNRFDGRREQTQDEGPKHNTFPLQQKGLPPRPGIPGPPSRNADSLPSSSTSPKTNFGKADSGGGIVGPERGPSRPPVPTMSPQGLDPLWYVGRVTRGQAEGCLKKVRKDGAYLVRDSTRQQPNQPYTLMVFYQDKVFNIQIRQENQLFQLGTGLKVHESFPSVSNIISHYSHSPLLLIDAKNRSASQQNQCLLSDPAAYWMGRQNWS